MGRGKRGGKPGILREGSFPPVLNLFLYQGQGTLSEGKGSVQLTSLLRKIVVKNRIIRNFVSLFFLALKIGFNVAC